MSYDLLDMLADMDRTPEELEARRRALEPRRFDCGKHLDPQEEDSHLADCWGFTCSGCGEHVHNAYLMRINHAGVRWGDGRALCGSIVLRLNHLTYALRHGELPRERDLTVVGMGYTIGPDGSQIAPDGVVNVSVSAHERDELFAKWAPKSGEVHA